MEVFAGKPGELGWSLMALSGTTTRWQLFRAGSGGRLQCQWGGTVQTCLGLVCQEALGRSGGGTPVGALLDVGIVIAAIEGIEKLRGKDVCDPKPLLSLSFFLHVCGHGLLWVGGGRESFLLPPKWQRSEMQIPTSLRRVYCLRCYGARPDQTKYSPGQDERLWMGTGAPPASLSSRGLYEGKRAGGHLPLLPMGRKEGRQRGVILLGEEPR